jgi:hypothetical protein
MMKRQFQTGLMIMALIAAPTALLIHQEAQAATKPKPEWRPAKASAVRDSVPPAAPQFSAPQSSALQGTPTLSSAVVADQSQEVLDVDFAMAASIIAQGPREGYGAALSDEGILYDSNGASPAGRQAAESRFSGFPADVSLIRTPERALAAGGSGSSWGTYTIKRGDTILSGGRYISVWRQEASGWKMISELAAGRSVAPPSSQARPETVLPKRPATLGRAAPSPVGVPLTVPTPPPPAPATPSDDPAQPAP